MMGIEMTPDFIMFLSSSILIGLSKNNAFLLKLAILLVIIWS